VTVFMEGPRARFSGDGLRCEGRDVVVVAALIALLSGSGLAPAVNAALPAEPNEDRRPRGPTGSSELPLLTPSGRLGRSSPPDLSVLFTFVYATRPRRLRRKEKRKVLSLSSTSCSPCVLGVLSVTVGRVHQTCSRPELANGVRVDFANLHRDGVGNMTFAFLPLAGWRSNVFEKPGRSGQYLLAWPVLGRGSAVDVPVGMIRWYGTRESFGGD